MPYTVSDIIPVIWPSLQREFQCRHYEITPITEPADFRGKSLAMYHRYGQEYALIRWSLEEEGLIPTERDRIAFARQLLENAIRSLNDIGRRMPEQQRIRWQDLPVQAIEPPIYNDEVVDVDFSED